MLEHDPYWNKSIRKMVSLLRDDGALFLYWGGALNRPHCFETSHDGKFHALPACKVIGLLSELGLCIHEFRYETSFMPQGKNYGPEGGVCLVAFKDKVYAIGESVMEPLRKADIVADTIAVSRSRKARRQRRNR